MDMGLLNLEAWSTYVSQLNIQRMNFEHRKSFLDFNFFNISIMFQYMIKFNKYMYSLNIKSRIKKKLNKFLNMNIYFWI
jgi:hypothetical protein